MDLDECKNEMRNIISELRDIERGIRNDFSNIGEKQCGDCIDRLTDKYDYVYRELSKIDKNFIASLIESIF
jgi:hypothetical protein